MTWNYEHMVKSREVSLLETRARRAEQRETSKSSVGIPCTGHRAEPRSIPNALQVCVQGLGFRVGFRVGFRAGVPPFPPRAGRSKAYSRALVRVARTSTKHPRAQNAKNPKSYKALPKRPKPRKPVYFENLQTPNPKAVSLQEPKSFVLEGWG